MKNSSAQNVCALYFATTVLYKIIFGLRKKFKFRNVDRLLDFFVFLENFGAKSEIKGETEEKCIVTYPASTDST